MKQVIKESNLPGSFRRTQMWNTFFIFMLLWQTIKMPTWLTIVLVLIWGFYFAFEYFIKWVEDETEVDLFKSESDETKEIGIDT